MGPTAFEAVAVAVAAPSPHDPRRFTYAVPEHLQDRLRPGHLVTVPFGDRTAYGLVTAPVSDRPAFALRDVERLLHPAPLVSPTYLALASWLAQTYFAAAFSAARLVLPPDSDTWMFRVLRVTAQAPDQASSRWGDSHRSWFGLLSRGRPVRWQRAQAVVGSATARRLYRHWAERDWLVSTYEVDLPTVLGDSLAQPPNGETTVSPPYPSPAPALSRDGAGRGAAIPSAVREHERGWEGVGKKVSPQGQRADGNSVSVLHAALPQTRFNHYNTMIRDCVEAGRQALLLVPDRQQISHAINQLRLDGLRVAAWHGQQGQKERLEIWARAQGRALDLVVGPRSALFLPLSRLGLIIVEQEYDDAYKNDSTPRYRASTVAVELGRLAGARVVLGSATPDAATYLQGRRGAWTLAQPPETATTARAVEVLDLRRERTVGRRELLSRPLHQALGATISSGGRAILLLTRRGSAHSLRCRDCGYTIRCPRCATPAAVHGQRARLLCHYCGSALLIPALCPQCGGARLRARGPGTQGLETELQTLFPRATVFRWDADTSWPPGGPAQVLDAFARGDITVLVGTQGLLRTPRVAAAPLVGVVDADTGLHLPDFRAAEWVFRSLLAAATLAGDTVGQPARVVVQTREPQHYCFRAFLLPRQVTSPSRPGAAIVPEDLRAAYARFMAADAVDRRELGYPPYGVLWRLLYVHRFDGTAEREATRCATALRAAAAEQSFPAAPEDEVEIIGPAPAYIRRLRDRARWHVLARGPHHRLAGLVEHVPRSWTIDTDPTTLL